MIQRFFSALTTASIFNAAVISGEQLEMSLPASLCCARAHHRPWNRRRAWKTRRFLWSVSLSLLDELARIGSRGSCGGERPGTRPAADSLHAARDQGQEPGGTLRRAFDTG